MPIYEYVCKDCEARYERLVMSRDARVACPKCGSGRHTLQFSVFASTKPDGASDGASASGPACACTPRGCGCH
jgi:putative FmdB family regulatory protein